MIGKGRWRGWGFGILEESYELVGFWEMGEREGEGKRKKERENTGYE